MTALPDITVDPGLHVPPYEQIREQFADLIASGVLQAGHRLPPIRQLAADLGLAAGTVARAYQELETAGFVKTRRAAGTVVAPQPTVASGQRVQAPAAQYARSARRLGLTLEQAIDAVKENWGPA